MTAALYILHWLAGFIVLAEALNKLERTAPFAPGLTNHRRIVDGLKALAWVLLAIGAGGAVATPILGAMDVHSSTSQMLVHQAPSFAETAVLLGFSVLIIRTRVKEG
jgi:hypothetical protein